jgi:uncharacterized protein
LGKSLKKIILFIIGTISLVLGTIGIFLPLIPTTPFLLLCAFCYLRSSQRFYDWLINHKVFGKHIYNYLEYKAVSLKTKIAALSFLWVSLIISIILVDILYVRLLLLVVGLAVSIHILLIKTLEAK